MALTDQTARTLSTNIAAARELFEQLRALATPLGEAARLLHEALRGGHKILCCGNGGSAADSAHFTAEIAGRYVIERRGQPAIDLTANHSLITALINDYPAEQVYARQVDALGVEDDVLVVLSTSGNSRNVVLALQAAKAKGIRSIAFLGRDGGRCRGLADVELLVPAQTTARIQEAHQLLYHTLCEALDPILAEF